MKPHCRVAFELWQVIDDILSTLHYGTLSFSFAHPISELIKQAGVNARFAQAIDAIIIQRPPVSKGVTFIKLKHLLVLAYVTHLFILI